MEAWLKPTVNTYFVSIAAGKAVIDGNTVVALSPQSPLGIKLNGLKSRRQHRSKWQYLQYCKVFYKNIAAGM